MNRRIFDNYYIGINKELAEGLGVNEAIVLQQIHAWLVSNEKRGLNYKNGRYWTFNSLKKWHENHFSFWSESTLKRVFTSLENKGILIVGNFNRSKLDRTKWYSINYDRVYEILDLDDEILDVDNEVLDVNDEVLCVDDEVDDLVCSEEISDSNCSNSKEEDLKGDDLKTCDDLKISNQKSSDSVCNKANSYNDNKHFVKLNECNCPDRKDELCQLDINNTNKNKNNTSIIRPQQPKQGCVAKKTREINFKRDVKAMLKKFLESAYTEGYFDKVIYILKDLGKDSAYLHDKIEMAKMKKLNSKCGFLLEALKNDYRDSACMGVSRNKFVDFGMMMHEYSEKELEEKIRKKQEKWCS